MGSRQAKGGFETRPYESTNSYTPRALGRSQLRNFTRSLNPFGALVARKRVRVKRNLDGQGCAFARLAFHV
jgi:hypothetical protein